jgi:hypothetical protein
MSSNDLSQSQKPSKTPLTLQSTTTGASSTSDKLQLNVSAQPFIPKRSTLNSSRAPSTYGSYQSSSHGYPPNSQRFAPMPGFQQAYPRYPPVYGPPNSYFQSMGYHQPYQDSNTFRSHNNNNTTRSTTVKNTSIALDISANPFQPKSKAVAVIPKKQEEDTKNKPSQPVKEKEQSPPIIERMYFIVNQPPSKQIIQTAEYINAFSTWAICKEKTLLSESTIAHLNKYKTYEEAFNDNNFSKKFERRPYERRSCKMPSAPVLDPISRGQGMQQWGRKDISKELHAAEIFKEQMEVIKALDPVKSDLKELLNVLTVDNYNDVKKQIYNLIQDDIEKQYKFLEVMFNKAVHEKAFVFLYAKVCKELDKELPQKAGPKEQGGKKVKVTSQMRSKLVEKCREIFKIEKNETIDNYIKVSDPTEREHKMKKFILGNANFISELIKVQVLSKKIAFQCIDNLFKRLENQSCDEMLKFVYLEAIVLFTDKFGTLVVNQKEKINNEDWEDFQKRIRNCLSKLNEIQTSMSMPGHVKYKIINLIEKEKAGWVQSSYEKSSDAKGKDEVRKEYEESQQSKTEGKVSQDVVNDKIRQDIKDFQEFLDGGESVNNYTWDTVEKLYSKWKCSLSSILCAYIEASIDLVQSKHTLTSTVEYWREMMSYYSVEMSANEKKDIISCTIELISQVHSLSLDNPLLIDVWAHVLIILNDTDVMKFKFLRELKNLSDDDLISLFKVFKKISAINKDIIPAIETIGFVKDNKELFEDVKV